MQETPPSAQTGERGGTTSRDEQLTHLAKMLRKLRKDRHLSIEGLAKLSGVSRSMISKIERVEAMPSTSVLSKLAEALEISFSQFLVTEEVQDIVFLKQAAQPVFTDAQSGFVRRCISPILPGRGIDWLVSTLPANTASGEIGGHRSGVAEYLYVLSGTLQADVGEQTYQLEAGDSLYFQATRTHQFRNVGQGDCVFFLIIDSTVFRR